MLPVVQFYGLSCLHNVALLLLLKDHFKKKEKKKGLWRFVLQVYAAWWNTLLQHYKLLLIVIVYNHKNKIQVDIALLAAVLSKSGLLVLCRAFCSPAKKYNNNKTERNHKKKKPWEKEGIEKENRKRNHIYLLIL